MKNMNKSSLANEEALKYLLEQAKNFVTKNETIPISESYGRVLAVDVFSDIDIPGADTSSRDGYCLKASSIAQASENNPVTLAVQSDEIHAGHRVPVLEKNKCMYIATGGVLPKGADSVAMLEEARVREELTAVTFVSQVKKGAYVRLKASETYLGEKVAEKHSKIEPELAGKIVSAGMYEVEVFKKPIVGILTSGDEIVSFKEKPKPWQVRTSNPTVMNMLIQKYGGICKDFGIAKDTGEDILNRFERGIKETDIIVTSGGIAMGRHDPVRNMFSKLGIESDFLKYGSHYRPVFYTVYKGKPVFALPGTPEGMYRIFEKFVAPFMLAMGGCELR